MNSVFVLNASPLILLGKADLLRTVSPLAKLWIVPDGVIAEVESKRPIDSYFSELEHNSRVSRESVDHIHSIVAGWDLGQGESEVLSLALKKDAHARAVLDDLQARKCANLLNVPLIGTLGLIVMSKRMGLVRSVNPEIKKLIEVGLRIDHNLLKEVYKKIDE